MTKPINSPVCVTIGGVRLSARRTFAMMERIEAALGCSILEARERFGANGLPLADLATVIEQAFERDDAEDIILALGIPAAQNLAADIVMPFLVGCERWEQLRDASPADDEEPPGPLAGEARIRRNRRAASGST